MVGCKTVEVIEAFTTSKVKLSIHGDARSLEPGFAEVVSAVENAVVEVVAVGDQEAAEGPGVIIDGRGYIVTNNHVISNSGGNPSSPDVSVTFRDGRRYRPT